MWPPTITTTCIRGEGREGSEYQLAYTIMVPKYFGTGRTGGRVPKYSRLGGKGLSYGNIHVWAKVLFT